MHGENERFVEEGVNLCCIFAKCIALHGIALHWKEGGGGVMCLIINCNRLHCIGLHCSVSKEKEEEA